MTLCERLRRKEPLAFDELVAVARPRLLAAMGDRDAAEDRVQEILISAYSQFSSFQGTTDRELWLWLDGIAARFWERGG